MRIRITILFHDLSYYMGDEGIGMLAHSDPFVRVFLDQLFRQLLDAVLYRNKQKSLLNIGDA